jgi:hypothetical protein
MPLQPTKLDLKQYFNNRFAELLREEEIKWFQKVKIKELLEGGGGALIPNTLSSVQMGNTGKLEFSNFTMGNR